MMRRARTSLLVAVAALSLAAGCSSASGPAMSAADQAAATASTAPTTDPYTLWIRASLDICDEVFGRIEELEATPFPTDPAGAAARLEQLSAAYREVAYRIGALPAPDRPGQDLAAPVRHLNGMADLVDAVRDELLGGAPVYAAESQIQTAARRGGAVLVDAGLTGCTEEA